MFTSSMFRYIALWTILTLTSISLVRSGGGHTPLMRLNQFFLEKGDLFMTHDSQLMLALDDKTLVRMPLQHDFLDSWTVLLKITPFADENIKYKAYRISAPKKYNPDRAVALATLLLGKLLPFGFWTCNQKNWMEYICYGKTHRNPLNYACPLSRDLNEVDVIDESFNLRNGAGELISITGLPTTSIINWLQFCKREMRRDLHSQTSGV